MIELQINEQQLSIQLSNTNANLQKIQHFIAQLINQDAIPNHEPQWIEEDFKIRLDQYSYGCYDHLDDK